MSFESVNNKKVGVDRGVIYKGPADFQLGQFLLLTIRLHLPMKKACTDWRLI